MADEFLKIGYKDSSYLVPTKNTFDKQQQSYINISDLEYINLGPNLLYNSSFSVNQRGLETYNKNLGSSQQDRYTVDRWNAVQTRIVQRSENTSYNIQAAKKIIFNFSVTKSNKFAMSTFKFIRFSLFKKYK